MTLLEARVTGVSRRHAWLAGFVVLWVLATCLFIALTHEDTSTVHHRRDGTFSLNDVAGPSFVPDGLFDHLIRYESLGCVVLSGNPSTRLVDWDPFLAKGGEAGAVFYQITSAAGSFVVAMPASNGYVEDPVNPDSQVIDLRNSVSDPGEAIPPSDVVILVDSETTCDQVLEDVARHPVAKSVTVLGHALDRTGEQGQMIHLHRPRSLRHPDHDAFVPRRSEFWTRHVKPVSNWLKNLWR